MEDENKVIAKIGMDENTSSKEPIFVSLSSFKNFKYLDIRKYYHDGGEWKPTKKGITMNLAQINEFTKAIADHKTEIESWFEK